MNRRPRRTLAKKIASVSTRAAKWTVALNGGDPSSPIDRLAEDAISLQGLLSDARLVQTHAKELTTWKDNLKARFAEQLFPALLGDRPEVFEKLLTAMANQRRLFSGKQKVGGRKKEAGRRLRLAILSMSPDELRSMSSVLRQLNQWQVDYSDESHVRRVMRELGVHLLRPGQSFIWLDLAGHIVRRLRVLDNGSVLAQPKSLENIRINPIRCLELIPREPRADKGPDK